MAQSDTKPKDQAVNPNDIRTTEAPSSSTCCSMMEPKAIPSTSGRAAGDGIQGYQCRPDAKARQIGPLYVSVAIFSVCFDCTL
ncbi:hypothetical protein CHS0354_025737 [Potamilus streckersoni]|uniref:Uncharacterized protein n=1 Tax=Potamilus streckersoni TaxID=2493646 RepID=A0AAE0SE56_9BIVA|nr:hypothetical protein CHS0354_025737 [Potamilus streckersoni]